MGKKHSDYAEVYTYTEMLKKVVGMTPHQHSVFVGLDSQCAATTDGQIPIYALLRVMNKIIQDSGMLSRNQSATDIDDLSIKKKMDHENLMSKQIANQTKLGILMRKSEMYIRVLKLISALNGLMKSVIMITAARMEGTKRDNVILLTDCYNLAINFMAENTNMLSWEADGAYRITQSRLTAISDMDDEIDKEIAKLNELSLSPPTQVVNPDLWKEGDPLISEEESLVD